jgi:tricarballylate dehydrogenase
MPYGNWSGCHVVAGDMNAPNYGDLALGDAFQKHSYPFGIHGECRTAGAFSTKATTFRMYTYVECGLALMQQPKAARDGRCSTARLCPCCATSTVCGM